MASPGEGGKLRFERDIRPLFRDKDRDSMTTSGAVDGPYALANFKLETTNVQTGVPAGFRRSRGGLEVVPGGGAAREGPRPPERNPQETPTPLVPVRDGSLPRSHLLWAAAALLLEVIADDAPGDLDASALAYEVANLLGEASGPVLPPGEPAWPAEPLTAGETRVLRYLPTHLAAPEIAAELYLSANTVKTHLRHLYRKLGAHSRQEAVQRARAIGLLTGSSR